MVIFCSSQTLNDIPSVIQWQITSHVDAAQVPFDSPEYYHQRDRSTGQSFEVPTRGDGGMKNVEIGGAYTPWQAKICEDA